MWNARTAATHRLESQRGLLRAIVCVCYMACTAARSIPAGCTRLRFAGRCISRRPAPAARLFPRLCCLLAAPIVPADRC